MADYKDWLSYKKGYSLALMIHSITKKFPAEERYSLTDQIRRSSRSVCANLAEAFSRRKYKNHFLSKLSDSSAENYETQFWLDFSKDLKLLSEVEYTETTKLNTETGKLIYFMINNPEKFI